MKSKHEYGNQPEGYSEHEVELAEDDMFEKNNKNAKAAFLADRQREESPGNGTSEGVQGEPPPDGTLHTHFMERRNATVNDRRQTAK